jgi:membrane-associated protease RseP (regulator of RpoE activity)
MSVKPEIDAGATTCRNCGLPMPQELRFCRNCGFRLGEGAAEYTETVRFQNAPVGTFPGNGAPNSGNFGFSGSAIAASPRGKIGKGKRRMSGMSWMFIGLLIFFIAAGAFTSLVKHNSARFGAGAIEIAPPRSYAGFEGLKTTEEENGVTFVNVGPPGGPADNAGLVGGDIITSLNGQAVHSDDEMTGIIRAIPIGQTVDVVYIRDGESKATKLTTISKSELDHLNREFRDRPGGKGRFGYDDDETERVAIPGTKMFGVRVDSISASLPADMAGIKSGDVIVEFDGVPIRTGEELKSRVLRAIPYSTVKLVVMRGGERLEIPVKMGKQ